jgi:hypothetical protein
MNLLPMSASVPVHSLLLGFLFCIARLARAQEAEIPLSCNPNLIANPVRVEAVERGGGSFPLPFFDDFSRYSLPTDDPEVNPDWRRWEDHSAYLNSHFPVSPPTVGVATLDGLRSDGYPYDFTDEFAQGAADTLTSIPLDLSMFSESDNVHLFFFYQRGGLGNNPDEDDSLVVEFFSPFGAGEWFQVWSADGGPAGEFEQAFIKVEAPEFFLDGFRFRFRNYATLSGAFDHWHIDYVVMRQGIDPSSFEFDEVAMQYPNYTLLQTYSAMPWTHYISNPSSFMRDSFDVRERNLGPTENIVTGFSVKYEGSVQNFPDQDFNTFGNANQEITRTLSIPDFQFDPSVNDTCAVFDVCVYINPTDLNLQNDTACFEQVFTNYYAYDDGSAERAYAVTSNGAGVAVKYRSEVQDTLLGLFIHWLPQGVDVSNQTFLLRVWGESSGLPGSELIENFESYTPHFYDDGHNVFSYYEFDQPVVVSGNFFVGWTQPNAIGLNVGNDKSTNTNPERLFYRLGFNQPWFQSSIEGSVMLRPVFRAGKSEVWNSLEEHAQSTLHVFPNPFEDRLSFMWPHEEEAHYTLFDMSGRMIVRDVVSGSGMHSVDTSSLATGGYIFQVTGLTGELSYQQLVIRP